jgi:AMP nucleosidase
MVDRLQITKNWLPRYTGMPLDNFGEYILLTNFRHYVDMFAEMFSCDQCRRQPTVMVLPLSTSA